MKITFGVLGLVATVGCAVTHDDVDSYIRSLGTQEAEESNIEVDQTVQTLTEGEYHCVVTPVHETKRYDEVVAMAVNSDGMWPGAIIQGNSIVDGLFTQVPVDRKPLSMSISLPNLKSTKSLTLENPKLSTYRDGIYGILDAELDGATPANLYAEIEEVYSKDQLELALGLEIEWLSNSSVAASFDWEREDIQSRYLVKYTQAYYTVDVDPPYKPSDYIANSVDVDELQDIISDTPPLYVSSITHGRLVVFTFESTYSSKEVNAALEFAYRGGVAIDGSVSLTHEEVLEQSKITAYILGGSGEIAAESIDGFDSLMDFIRGGGNFSKESPGAPIAYKLSHLADNSPARFSLTHDYDRKECERVSQKVRVTLESIGVVNGGSENRLEVYGNITANAAGQAVLFDKSTSQRIQIRESESWPQQGIISDQVIDVVPQPGEALEFDINLRDYDPLSANDSIGVDVVVAPFELGWRRQMTIPLTGSKAHLEVVVSMQPI